MRPEWWAPTGELDPFAGFAEPGDALLVSVAWEAGGERLPTRPEFHHAWAGLLKLADRIGSDSERFFPFSIDSGGDRGLRSPGCGPVKSS